MPKLRVLQYIQTNQYSKSYRTYAVVWISRWKRKVTKLSSKVYKQYLLSNGRIHTFLPNNFTTKKRTVIFSRELPYWYSLSLTDTENCYWGKLLLSLWLRWSQTRQFLWLQTKTKNKVTTTTINVYRLPIMQQSNRTPRRTEKYPHLYHSVHVA